MKNIFSKALVFTFIVPAMALTACQQPATTTKNDSYGIGSQATNTTTTTSKPVTTNSMQMEAPKAGDTIATVETDKGTIKFKLFTKEAPETAKNFMELAKEGKYDNVPFHRVISGFMIQTGDFTNKNGTGGHSYKGPGTKINDEFSPELKNYKGTVSMANSGPNTNGSQFFIVTGASDMSYLNNHYSVFGQVFEGQDVADAISNVQTGPSDNPLSPLNIKKVTISTL